jgi:type IV secretion system protein VirD4
MRIILGALAVIVLLYGWIVAASALFCLVAGDWAYYVFPYDQWLYVVPYYAANWYMTVCVIVSAVIPTIALGVIAKLLWRTFRWRRRHLVSGADQPIQRGGTDNHGHAAWATRQQLDARFSGHGCLIGAMSQGGPLLFDDLKKGPTHNLIVAGPGSFKSMTAVLRIWHWMMEALGSCVVFDPSLEIGPIMTDALRAKGFKVVTIGLNGDGFNVLDWIDLTHPESDAHIRSVTDWIFNEGGTVDGGQRHGSRPDPFFSTWGKSLITCLLAHMLHTAPPGLDRTLTALRRGIAIPENDMQAALTAIHATSRSSMARELAGGLMGMASPKTFSNIYSEAFSGTEWLSVDAYADVVSGTAMQAAEILERGTVVFLQLPLRSLLATPAIARAMMGALFNAMFHADTGGADRVLFQLDEAWLLGAMKEIKLCHTTARKYRGTISSIWQSEGQLEEVWGRDGAKLMRDTCSWRSYNAVQDGDVADKLSRDIGEHAVLAHSEGDNQGRQKPWGIALPSSSHGTNVNTHEIKRRLIKGDEIMRAPAGEMYVLVRDFPQPIRCFSAPYFLYPEVSRLMNGNRFNAAAE